MNQLYAGLKYLFTHPAFRENPVALSARLALWLLYCAARHSPRFKLTDEVWFEVDPVLRHSGASSAFVLRRWAEPELRYLDKLLTNGGGFIDCGANIGIYTVRAAAIVGRQGKVIAVEPGAVSFSRLRTNIGLNGFSQVILVNEAISDTAATARLYHADGGPASFSLVPKAGTDFEEVQTTTIDRLVEEYNLEALDCIKLDVEGFEIPALKGAGETIARFKPAIIVERTSLGAKRLAASEGIADILLTFGYLLYQYAADFNFQAKYEIPNLVAIHPASNKVLPSILRAWNPVSIKSGGPGSRDHGDGFLR